MKGLRYLLFSLICMFCCSIVFAANEVVIKSITPVYDEESTVLVTEEENNHSVIFNDKNQSVKYNVVIENTTEDDLKVSNIDLTKPSEDYLIYEIDGIAKDDVLKSKNTQELVISITTAEKDKKSSDFAEELLAKITFEENVTNPNTSSKELIIIFTIIAGIALIGILLFKSNNKISRYVAIIIICYSIIPIINAATKIELQIKINVNYAIPGLVEIVSGDGTKVGDELKIGEEHFYVVSNDGTNAVLLAKYNLEVGKIYTIESGALVDIENPSGLQNAKALGWVNDGTEAYGVVPFSSTNYWYNNDLKSEYGTSYPAYVYDDNASIKIYVDNYAEYLEQLGLTIEEARLIKQEELVILGCDADSYTCTTSEYEWVYSTTYWSGSAYGYINVWRVFSFGYFDGRDYDFDHLRLGVRPVIVIPSSEI